MRMGVAVNDPEGVAAAGCQQKIMSANRVFHYFKHNIAAVGVKGMSLCEEDRPGVVDGAARRKAFAGIASVKTNKIRYLFAL